MAKKKSKPKASKPKASKPAARTAKKAAKPAVKPDKTFQLSMGSIVTSMRTFIAAVDASGRTEPYLLEAKTRVSEMLGNMPKCLAASDADCKDENPPKGCRFVPIAPQ